MRNVILSKIEEIKGLAESKNDALPTGGLESIIALENQLRILPNDESIDIHQSEYASLLDQAVALELQFENMHPRLSALLREIIKILSDMGV